MKENCIKYVFCKIKTNKQKTQNLFIYPDETMQGNLSVMYLRHLALSDKMQHPHKDCGPLKCVKMNKTHQNDQKAEKLKADFGCGLCKKEEKNC